MRSLPDYAGMVATIDRWLKGYCGTVGADARRVRQAMQYALFSGGKRLRPIIVLEACRAAGGNCTDAKEAACAIECIHTYSLIHDDLPAMDDDDERRGRPTVHKKFDEATAILAGDALLTLAFAILARHRNPIQGFGMVKVLAEAAGIEGMVGGQADDLCRPSVKRLPLIRSIHARKTGRLFEASARLGALSAGTTFLKEARLASFGRAFGRAFQLVDDILDRDDAAEALGVAKAREEAARATREALKAAEAFGKKGENLRRMAAASLERTA